MLYRVHDQCPLRGAKTLLVLRKTPSDKVYGVFYSPMREFASVCGEFGSFHGWALFSQNDRHPVIHSAFLGRTGFQPVIFTRFKKKSKTNSPQITRPSRQGRPTMRPSQACHWGRQRGTGNLSLIFRWQPVTHQILATLSVRQASCLSFCLGEERDPRTKIPTDNSTLPAGLSQHEPLATPLLGQAGTHLLAPVILPGNQA
jgi:hypothetical protein